MLSFEGYDVLEPLQQSDNHRAFKALRKLDNKPVIINFYQTDTSIYANLSHIKNIFHCLQEIHSTYLVEVYDLLFTEDGVAVIMEYFPGRSLKALLADKKSFSLNQVLSIIEHISVGLEILHSKKVIHQEITPNNIAILEESAQIKITGFGIFSAFSHQPALNQISNLLYMSPEQTGRMNRSMDQRSDLYSVGVIFYELLCGHPPFESTDILELMHAHIAQPAIAPFELVDSLPVAVSDIILKLLCKEAENRYQSAYGLTCDIRACIKQLEESGAISPQFKVGALDSRSLFQIPEKLYGRSGEIQKLLNTFESCANGGFETILVGGYSGVGKSALINEIQKPLVAKRGLYTSGKYDQFKKAQPYSAIIQALAGMVRQILAKPKGHIRDWSKTLLKELKGEGQCLVEVLPILQSLIGEQKPLPELNSVETQTRFNRGCEAFTRAFSAQSHPFILFLDDLQWADLASLNLIQHLITCHTPYMLLIMAYRDNEVDSHHPFSMLMHNSKEKSVHFQEISLQPIKLLDTENLVSDTLHKEKKQIEPLAQALMLKTQGNPFFLTQLFSALHQDELIRFNQQQGWQWDMNQIREANLSGDVVTLMTRKIKKYSQSTQSALNMCAILGAEFKLSMASLGLEQHVDATYQALLPAIQDGLVKEQGKRLKFAHDKIHESSYGLWPKDKRVQRHALIARFMLSTLDDEAIDNEIFSIVEHLNNSSEQVSDPQEKISLARYNYLAGIKARQSSAFEPAVAFFQQAKNYLTDDIWQQLPAFAFELNFALAQSAYTTANFDLAEATIKQCMSHEREQIKITPVVQLYQDLFFASGRHDEGIAFALNKLKEYGLSLPAKPNKVSVMLEYMALKFRQRLRSTQSLVNLPATSDKKRLCMMGIIANMVPSCYMVNGDLMGFISLRMANLSLKYGNNLYSSFGYAMTGLVETGILKRIKGGREYYDLSVVMQEKYPNKLIKGRNMMLMSSFAAPWTEPIDNYSAMMEPARTLNAELGILQWTDYCVVFTRAQSLFFGRDKLSDIHKENLKWLDFHTNNGDQQVIANQKFILHFIEYWRMLTPQEKAQPENKTGEPCFDEKQHARTIGQQKNVTFQAYYQVLKQMDFYLQGDYKPCVVQGMGLFMTILDTFGICLDAMHRYFYLLAYLALDKSMLNTRQRIQAKLYFHLNKFYLYLYQKNRPDNYGAHYALVKAELYRSKNCRQKALDHYEKSIALSTKTSLFNEALAHERIADFHLSLNHENSALMYAGQARKLYHRWGNQRQVERINKRYPNLALMEDFAAGTGSSLIANKQEQLDLMSLARGSQAISSEVRIDNLIEALLKQLVQSSGAEKALLLLEENGEILIQGELNTGVNKDPANPIPDKGHPPNRTRVAESVIQFVARSKNLEVLADAASTGNFTQDPYIIAHKVKSLLCMPILNQGKLLGILYLENNLTTHAFTQQHQQVLEILASQAAISMVNAKLYTGLEEKVAERTQTLHDTMDQLIEAKKIAALGKVVAGVAHEINTPLGIGLTSGTLLKSNIEKIRDRYQSGSMTKTKFEDYINRNIETLNLLIENLSRATKLVKRFKSTASGKTGEPKSLFNVRGILLEITDGLARELSSHDIVINCPRGIEMQSYPLALTLVITNLIHNSLAHGFTNNFNGVITIEVSESKNNGHNNVVLEYYDNGKGIKESHLSKVFDPFFTTNMGTNTGLGLHIVYNVITSQFGGSIRCENGKSKDNTGAHFHISLPQIG